MARPDSSRGIPYNFDAAKFRNAIGFAFEMEADPIEDNQLTFHFPSTKSFTGRADGDKVPFNPADTVTTVTPDPVKVPCDVTFTAQSDSPTAFGSVVPAKLTVLLLDVDYVKVKDAAYVVMKGDRYNRLYEPPSNGLFNVGLHEIVYQAENEN